MSQNLRRFRFKYFSGLPEEFKQQILNSPLNIYVCEGDAEEIKEWFKTINIAGIPLIGQELRNAIYSGPFVTAAKAVFSNSLNSNIQKWSHYIKGILIIRDGRGPCNGMEPRRIHHCR